MKNRKVPKLRFKEFTDEWEEKRLGEIILLQRGSSPRPIVKYLTASIEGVNWIKIGDTNKENKYIISTTEKITKEGAKKSREVKKGEIILSNSMSYGRPFILKIDGYIHDGWFVIRKYEKNFLKEFLCQLLTSPLIQKQYKKLAAGGVVENISSELVNSVIVGVTTLQEQQKIADFLSCVDTKISLTEEKLENLKIYKKGIMQKIFSQEIRFKDKNGNDYPEWEETKLGDLVEEYIEKTIINNQYQVLSSTATGIYLQEEYFKKQTASENNIGYRIIPKNYFTYRSMSDTGNFTFNIQKIIEKGIVSPAYPVFKNKQEVILKEYLYFTLNNSKKIIEQILVLKEGGTRYALSFSKFLKLKLDVPILEEQQKIADFLSSIDDKIEKTENKLNELKKFKKGLLQKMFV